MSAAVIIPYGGTCEYRARSRDMLVERYRHHFVRHVLFVRVAENHDPRFNRAKAVNDAVAMLPGGCDLLLINDSDSFVPDRQIEEALDLATAAPGLVRAYTRYRRLSKATTDRCDSWQQILNAADEDIEWQQEPAYAHGVAAIQRECFQEAGGYDPKFAGWGYEDMAFELALDARWPDRRVPGDLFHHWHPLGIDPDAERENANLYYNRYEPLRGNADALLALRNEEA